MIKISHETEAYANHNYRIECRQEADFILCFIEFEKNSEKAIRIFFNPDEFTLKLEKAMEEVINKLKKTRGEKSWKH